MTHRLPTGCAGVTSPLDDASEIVGQGPLKNVTTKVDYSVAIVDCIENFYSPQRRHSSLSYLTPNEFENLHLTQTQVTFS
jgi:hypothetical protein